MPIRKPPENCMWLGNLYRFFEEEKSVGPKTEHKFLNELVRFEKPKVKGLKNVWSVLNIEKLYLVNHISEKDFLFKNKFFPVVSKEVSDDTLERLLMLNKNHEKEIKKEKLKFWSSKYDIKGLLEKKLSVDQMIYKTKIFRHVEKNDGNILNVSCGEELVNNWYDLSFKHAHSIDPAQRSARKVLFELVFASRQRYHISRAFNKSPEKNLNDWEETIDYALKKIYFRFSDSDKRYMHNEKALVYFERAKYDESNSREFIDSSIHEFQESLMYARDLKSQKYIVNKLRDLKKIEKNKIFNSKKGKTSVFYPQSNELFLSKQSS